MTSFIYRMLLLLSICSSFSAVQAQTWAAPFTLPYGARQGVELYGPNSYLTPIFRGTLTGTAILDTWGTQTTFSNFSMDVCEDFKRTSNNRYIFIGSTLWNTPPDSTPVLVEMQANGRVRQYHTYDRSTYGKAPMSVRPTLDGGFVFLSIDGNGRAPNDYNLQLTKVDSAGTPLWTQIYGDTAQQRPNAVRSTPDGGYLMVGAEGADPDSLDLQLVKVDGVGTVQWSRTYSRANRINDVRLTDDGGVVVQYYTTTGSHVGKFDDLGNVEWTYTSATPIVVGTVVSRSNGGYAFAHGAEMILLDTAGVVISTDSILTNSYVYPRYGSGFWNINFSDMEETKDGGFILRGVLGANLNTPDVIFVKADSSGRVSFSALRGKVYEDVDADCQYDAFLGDQSRANIRVTATSASGEQRHTTTDGNGDYYLPVPLGTYTISTDFGQPHPYAAACRLAPVVTISNDTSIVHNDLGYEVQVACPYLEVSLEPNLLRIGVDSASVYTLAYCNHGTDTARGAYVEVRLDSSYVFQGSSVPVASQQGRMYTFQLGDLAPSDCGAIYLYGMIQAGTPLGQIHCSEAHIYPDSSCLPPNDPFIEIFTECQGTDTLLFMLYNTGANMTTAMPYNVFEDHLMMRQGSYQLNNGERDTIRILTLPGKLYRMEAIPTPLTSGLVGQHQQRLAWAVAGACQTSVAVDWSTLNTFYLGRNESTRVVNCRPNQGSFDPNDKTGYPLGYGNNRQISPNLPLTYKIRFQNTGTDTAFRVVIVDTLSPLLNPATVRLQASSHPMHWTLHEGNILKVTYNPIELPDSNVNEPASHGFVTFRIDHVRPLVLPAVVQNSAAIYFDANAPILTNTTLHTVDTNYRPILVHVDKPELEHLEVKVYPNPFHHQTTIELLGGAGRYTLLTLEVYDALGRQVEQQQSNTHQFTLERGRKTEGVYFYRIRHNDELLNTGRLIIGR